VPFADYSKPFQKYTGGGYLEAYTKGNKVFTKKAKARAEALANIKAATQSLPPRQITSATMIP
jgi:hypothetical protein